LNLNLTTVKTEILVFFHRSSAQRSPRSFSAQEPFFVAFCLVSTYAGSRLLKTRGILPRDFC
jgi:hypothetical protein